MRPRTILDSLNGVRCALRVINEAKIDATHVLHHLATQVTVDGNFVKAQHALHKQFRLFTNFFDQSHSWQVIFLHGFSTAHIDLGDARIVRKPGFDKYLSVVSSSR